MDLKNPLLPVTVQDQIRLWELERNRVKADEGTTREAPTVLALTVMAPGFLWTEFTSQADYDLVRDYAHKLNFVIWENPQKRMFFASAEGHANIRTFIERRKQAMTSG